MFNISLSSLQKAASFRKNIGHSLQADEEYINIARTLSFLSLRQEDVRIAFAGESIPARLFCDAASYVKNDSMVELYFSGATLILQSVNRYSREIEMVRRDIEHFFGKKTHVNAYLTPAHSNGLGYHIDEYDVLILQLYGEKVWLTRSEPNRTEFCSVIKFGEWGYIPCRVEHATRANIWPSLHLTFGIGSKAGESNQINYAYGIQHVSPIEVFNKLLLMHDIETLLPVVVEAVDVKQCLLRNASLNATHPLLYKYVSTNSKGAINEFLTSDRLTSDLKKTILMMLIRVEPNAVEKALSKSI
jgi:hypothetical protein